MSELGQWSFSTEMRDKRSSFSLSAELFELFIPVVGSKNIQFANGQEGRARRRLHDTCFAHGAVCNMIPTFQKVRMNK